jgi:hypothetical protein
MTTEHQTRKIPLDSVIGVGIVLAVLFLQFRLLSFSLIAVSVALVACFARCRSKSFVIPAIVALAISLFLPFDIALGSYHFGTRRGRSPGGPHFAEFVVGLPMHTQLIARYGEYISGGCAWPALFPPRWVLVWD